MTSLCYRCREFLDTEAVFAFDQLWHNNCFRCFKCEKSLINEWYIKLQESGDNNVVCVECSKPLCNGCNKCIDDERVKAIGVLWHRECLKCTECNETLINEVKLFGYFVFLLLQSHRIFHFSFPSIKIDQYVLCVSKNIRNVRSWKEVNRQRRI